MNEKITRILSDLTALEHPSEEIKMDTLVLLNELIAYCSIRKQTVMNAPGIFALLQTALTLENNEIKKNSARLLSNLTDSYILFNNNNLYTQLKHQSPQLFNVLKSTLEHDDPEVKKESARALRKLASMQTLHSNPPIQTLIADTPGLFETLQSKFLNGNNEEKVDAAALIQSLTRFDKNTQYKQLLDSQLPELFVALHAVMVSGDNDAKINAEKVIFSFAIHNTTNQHIIGQIPGMFMTLQAALSNACYEVKLHALYNLQVLADHQINRNLINETPQMLMSINDLSSPSHNKEHISDNINDAADSILKKLADNHESDLVNNAISSLIALGGVNVDDLTYEQSKKNQQKRKLDNADLLLSNNRFFGSSSTKRLKLSNASSMSIQEEDALTVSTSPAATGST